MYLFLRRQCARDGGHQRVYSTHPFRGGVDGERILSRGDWEAGSDGMEPDVNEETLES